MNMKKITHEHISAFIDAELVDQEITTVLAALRVPERREAWDVYHRIGDVLRSEDLAYYEMRPQAQARMAALLDAEPVVSTPVQTMDCAKRPSNDLEWLLTANQAGPAFIRTAKYFFRPGIAVVATAAVVAFFTAPPLMVAFNGWRTGSASHMASSGSPVMAAVENGNIKLKADAATKDDVVNVADTGSSNEMLRDINMDEYLFAHQRFSRFGYGNAQYANPTTFTTENAK